MMPEVSAGSNQVGASVTWTAHVIWPSAPAARVEYEMPSTRGRAISASKRRRPACLARDAEYNIAARLPSRKVIAFPFDRSRTERTFSDLSGDCNPDSAHARQHPRPAAAADAVGNLYDGREDADHVFAHVIAGAGRVGEGARFEITAPVCGCTPGCNR